MTGRAFVVASAVAFILCGLIWLFSKEGDRVRRFARPVFTLGCGLMFGAFLVLAGLFVGQRFEYEYIWEHGDLKNAIPYRIAGVWAGQQGSFLLWAVCAAIFGLLALPKAGYLIRWYGVAYSAFLATLGGILAFESPFGLNLVDGKPVMPLDGQGLSPALQNYWVTIHPPVIFLGFGALTVPFAMAFAALMTKKLDEWVPIVRPWALISMTLVGVGLCMGGFWAYETLGWGGFWMWDPVENTSFVPWVLVAAFSHGLLVQSTKRGWAMANPLLGAIPFISFVYGTFLTRSGLLGDTSVHSFAQMDSTALKLLLGILGVSLIGFVILWGVRAVQMSKAIEKPVEVEGWHREAFIRIGSFLLIAMAIAAGIGMSMPMVMNLMGRQPSVVQEGLYHRVMPYMFIPMMVVMAAGPLVAWKGMGIAALATRLYGTLCLTLVGVGIAMVAASRSPWTPSTADAGRVNLIGGLSVPTFPWVLFLAAICLFAALANVVRIVELGRRSPMGMGSFLAHIGVCVLMAGLIISRGLERKQQVLVQEGAHNMALGQMIVYRGMTKTLTDRDNRVLFDVVSKGGKFTASPGFYYVQADEGQPRPMVWPHIQRELFHDFYFTLHDRQTDATNPVSIDPGQTQQVGNFMVTYTKPTRTGEPGQTGTRFGAELQIASEHGGVTVNPQMEIGSQGIVHHDVGLGESYVVSLVGLDASTQTATVQFKFARPIYQVEVFYKPLTILVWLGTALLAFSGFLAAWYRWPRKAPTAPAAPAEPVAEKPKVKAKPKSKPVGTR